MKMKKVLYVYGGPEFHPTKAAGELLSDVLKYNGEFELEMTPDLDAFINLPDGKYDTIYDTIVVYTTGFNDQLTAEREKGLLGFIRNGGGFVGIHSAADSFRNNSAYIEMLGCEFLTHPRFHDFTVSIVNKDHYITTRFPDFTISDEMYHLQNYDPSKVTLLAETPWQDKRMPMAYVKEYGKGRVAYLANGHDLRAWKNPEFQKLLTRAIAWSTGAEKPNKKIRCGIIGYGGAFNMGQNHANWINSTEGLETIAVCDVSTERIEVAKQELPGLEGYFTNLDDMLAMDNMDLAVVILPHSIHASITLKCLEAGKHVIVEKPFCITTDEANRMINKAREKDLMLSVFHNRRWDADYLTIKEIIDKGLIGDVFHIEASSVGYAHPGFWWRSSKEVSGGIMYDWGAHYLDWIINLVPYKVVQVAGDFQKRVWQEVTNEDYGKAFIWFDNGVTAEYLTSNIAAVTRPSWQILGTKGSIEKMGQDLILTTFTAGIKQSSKVEEIRTLPSWAHYYRKVADHLLMGEELPVKAEEARRVIAIINAAEESSRLKKSVALPEGCE